MGVSHPRGASRFQHPERAPKDAASGLAVLVILILAFFSSAVPALASTAPTSTAYASSASTSAAFVGRSSTGKLAFYPCTKCHPVTLGPDGQPTKPLPNGFKKHDIQLQAHDILGPGTQACLACHDDPSRNPGMLKLADGSLVDVTGDVSRVCQRCHFEKYQQWQVGVHGKHQPQCTSAGCHDPHTPQWIYVAALPPVQGTGIEVRAVGVDRGPFKPLASPPVPAAVETPLWLAIFASLGVVTAIGIIGFLIVGRPRR